MDEFEIECYRKAGKIGSEIKVLLDDFVRPGVRLLDIANFIEDKIIENGAVPAFPTNLSIDEIAAHYTPVPNDNATAKGLLKIDFGVCVDGYIDDTSVSFDLTDDKKFEKMMELNRGMLEAVQDGLDGDSIIRDVGEIVTNILDNYNKKNGTDFKLIHSLCGHGLGKDLIHTGKIVPNYKNNANLKFDEMAFAVEPFVTDGYGDIYEGNTGNIYSLNSDLMPRDREARKMLDYIKEHYKTRPFCERWLVRAGFKMTRYCLKVLEQAKIIYQYPLLIEKGKGVVCQFENSFICHDGKMEILI